MRLRESFLCALLILTSAIAAWAIVISSDTYKLNKITGQWDLYHGYDEDLLHGNTSYAPALATAQSTATLATAISTTGVAVQNLVNSTGATTAQLNATYYFFLNGGATSYAPALATAQSTSALTLTASNTNYIKNQNAVSQTANFNISGTGYTGGTFTGVGTIYGLTTSPDGATPSLELGTNGGDLSMLKFWGNNLDYGKIEQGAGTMIIEPATNGDLWLNYDRGTGGIRLFDGALTQVASINGSGFAAFKTMTSNGSAAQGVTNTSSNSDGSRYGLTKTSGTARGWTIGATGPTNAAGDNKLSIRDATADAYRIVIDSIGQVGIGIATPTAQFQIFNSSFIVQSNAFTGIGITTPTMMLDVNGSQIVHSSLTVLGGVEVGNNGTNSAALNIRRSDGTPINILRLDTSFGANALYFGSTGLQGQMYFQNKTSPFNWGSLEINGQWTLGGVTPVAGNALTVVGNTNISGSIVSPTITDFNVFRTTAQTRLDNLDSSTATLTTAIKSTAAVMTTQFTAAFSSISTLQTATGTIVVRLNNLDLSTATLGLTASNTNYLTVLGSTQTKLGGLNITGNVGIGTTAPAYKTDILYTKTSGDESGLNIKNTATANTSGINLSGVKNFTLNSQGSAGFDASGGLGIYDGSAYRMVINSGGNVGIGTTAPASILHVFGGATAPTPVIVQNTATTYGPELRLVNTGAGGEDWRIGSGQSSNSAGQGSFYVYNTADNLDRFVITNNGNVGIGTVSPNLKMQIFGAVKIGGDAGTVQDGALALGDDASTALYNGIFRGTSLGARNNGNNLILAGYDGVGITVGHAEFGGNGALKVFVNGSGNVGIGTPSPQCKLQVYGPVKIGGNAATSQEGALALGDDLGPELYNGMFRGTAAGAYGGANNLLLAGYEGVGIVTGHAQFGSQGSPRLYIDVNGNVGIGTTGPTDLLHTYGGSTRITQKTASSLAITRWENDGSSVLALFHNGSTFTADGPANSATLRNDGGMLRLQDSTASGIWITGGNVGIGTVGPVASFHSFNGAAVQGVFSGYSPNGARAATDSGAILLGSLASSRGALDMDGSGATTLSMDSTYDSASAVTQFRMRTSGTPVTAMTILGSGLVGIGTASPSAALHIANNAGGTSLYLNPTGGNGVLEIGNNKASETPLKYKFITVSSGTFQIRDDANATALFNVMDSGNVGVGTVSPTNRFQVTGTTIPSVFAVTTSGLILSSGTVVTLTGCGTAATLNPGSTVMAGSFNTGVAPGTCVLSWAAGFPNAAFCHVEDDTLVGTVHATNQTKNSVTVTGTIAVNDIVSWWCNGN